MAWMCRTSGRLKRGCAHHSQESMDECFEALYTRRPNANDPDVAPGCISIFRQVATACNRLDTTPEFGQRARQFLSVSFHVTGDVREQKPRIPSMVTCRTRRLSPKEVGVTQARDGSGCFPAQI